MRYLPPLLALLATACSPSWKRVPHDRYYQRVAPAVLHKAPQATVMSDWWDRAQSSSVQPLARALSPARWLYRLGGGRTALDINHFGQVPDSQWFENRICRGLHNRPRPAAPKSGPLTILRGDLEGLSPGFLVEDAGGTKYFIKFDPPAQREISTSAERIATQIMYAAGYHVPQTFLIDIDLPRLRVAQNAWHRDDYNRRVRYTKKDLAIQLEQLNPDMHGRVRALFSRAVDGIPLGPFRYAGVRHDDPNDRIAHERRRSLRGLWLFSAWLNNTDTRTMNTLDTFLRQPNSDKGFVKHHVIDFGDSLGASGDREKVASEGHQYLVDWRDIGRRLFTFGARYPRWMAASRSPYRAVGIFDAELFEPALWRPAYMNPAFLEATPKDTFWAASILACFDRETVTSYVASGRYSERGASAWVTEALMKRREKLLRFAFKSMLPVDRFRVTGHALYFDELDSRLTRASHRYRARILWAKTAGRDRALATQTSRSPHIDLTNLVSRIDNLAGFARDPFIVVELTRPHRPAQGTVSIRLRWTGQYFLPVSVHRTVGPVVQPTILP